MPDPTPFPPELRDAILDWYAGRGRILPFRGTTDPYAILVSETMAQQTQVSRAGEAWIRFMTRFPTVGALADASPADVFREWEGLGYNRRALSLWRAARVIVEQHDGQVPSAVPALEALPGVGPYTARAVAALAFGTPVGAVDTNVRRVLGRVMAGDIGVLGSAELQAIADDAVPPDRPGTWTHALMDLGAMVCLPVRPRCEECPAVAACRYAARIPSVAVSGPVGGEATSVPARTTTTPRARAVRRPVAPFPTTTRWLRGRTLDRLRRAPDGEWVTLDPVIGVHDERAVEAATRAMARDGLVELDDRPPLGRRARLPIG